MRLLWRLDIHMILLVDYQSTSYYRVDPRTQQNYQAKKAIQFIQNSMKERDVQRKARKSYTNTLLFIGAYLKKFNYAVEYISMPDEDPLFQDKVKKSEIVYFTAVTPVMPFVESLINSVKQVNPSAITILGGVHASALPEETLNEVPLLDYISIGESEGALLEFIRGKHVESIAGWAYRKHGTVFINKELQQLRPEEIPAPDYSLLNGDLKKYRYNIQFTRGCPYRCKYCVNGYFWKTVRHRTEKSIREELLQLKEILGTSFEIHIVDNIVCLDLQYIRNIAKIVNDLNMHISFTADIRAEHVKDVEAIQAMEELGIVKVFMGFEDSSYEIRYNAGRKTTTEEMVYVLQLLRDKSKIAVDCYWMLGLPGTTAETIRHNAEFVARLIQEELIEFICPDIIFVPLPGTPMFHDAKKFGIHIKTTDWHNYQRSSYKAVYELENLGIEAFYRALIEFDRVIIDAALEKLQLSEVEAVEAYFKANKGKCVENYLISPIL